MKKILLLCSVAFIFACSNENEATTQENSTIENTTTASKPLPPIENEIDEMFYQYVNSDIYIEVRELVLAFNNDLHHEGEFEQEEDLFNWIELNVDLTDFNSVEEAKYSWGHIKERISVEINTFPNVYNFMITTPQETVVKYVIKWQTEVMSTGHPPYCVDAFNVCSATAAGKLAGDYVNSVDPKTGMADLAKQTAAVNKFVTNSLKCMNDFNECAGIK